ncbi:MAG TPA: tetratricopeptide repeat protein [Methylomirabilota bacterium]|nr:tetratricopeptide repeat protein [Methylomirabilota bacterium]
MAEHISRKELKQDKIKETFEHGAEAVISHGQIASIVVAVILVVAVGYFGWRFYSERRGAQASEALQAAMKAYQGRVGGTPDPTNPSDVVYPTDQARVEDALSKFLNVADKYSSTNPGKLARYYAALCLEDLERHNQALEELKKISGGSDKELSAMAQYQMAVIEARTGKTDDAVKLFRALADKPSALVPRPLALLELAEALRKSNPKEAATVYQQVKKEYPDTTMADKADRGLDSLPKS